MWNKISLKAKVSLTGYHTNTFFPSTFKLRLPPPSSNLFSTAYKTLKGLQEAHMTRERKMKNAEGGKNACACEMNPLIITPRQVHHYHCRHHYLNSYNHTHSSPLKNTTTRITHKKRSIAYPTSTPQLYHYCHCIRDHASAMPQL